MSCQTPGRAQLQLRRLLSSRNGPDESRGAGDRRQTDRGGRGDRDGEAWRRHRALLQPIARRSREDRGGDHASSAAACSSSRRTSTKAADCEAFVNEGAAALGRLDILVNMASIYVAEAVQRADRRGVRRERRGRHAVGVHLLARRLAAHAACRRRQHHQFFRLAVAERTPAVHRAICRTTPRKPESSASPKRSRSSWRPTRFASTRSRPGPILAPPETTEDELASVEKATPLGSWGGEKCDRRRRARAAELRLRDRRDVARGRGKARTVNAMETREIGTIAGRSGFIVASYFTAAPPSASASRFCSSNISCGTRGPSDLKKVA